MVKGDDVEAKLRQFNYVEKCALGSSKKMELYALYVVKEECQSHEQTIYHAIYMDVENVNPCMSDLVAMWLHDWLL